MDEEPPEVSDALATPSWRTEVVAGVTTFLTMSYIVVVNPGILATDGTGMPFSGAMTATVLVAFVATFAMGLFARLPYALAPGMGINALFTYTLVLSEGVSWQVALGLTFWSGVLFLLLSVTPAREAIALALPTHLRAGAAAGIGLLLTLIGLKNAGVVVDHPATLVSLGPLDAKTVLFALGLLVAVVLHRRKNPFAFVAAIAVGTVGGLALGHSSWPESPLAMPDVTSTTLALDPMGAVDLALVPALFTLLFTDLFDSLSTFVAVARASDLEEPDGQPTRLREGLAVDAFATLASGLLGSSSATTYIESAAGIEAGGRTGRTAVVCALCFLPLLFFGPVVAMIPAYATAPVLVLVGAAMFSSVRGEDLSKLEDRVPVFLCAVLMPLTFSITQGLLWGMIAHVALYAATGRGREVKPLMWGLGALAIGLLYLETL